MWTGCNYIDDCEKESCVHVALHDKRKTSQEMRATKFTPNQTVCPIFKDSMDMMVEQRYVIKSCECL